jgi:hypothetical protein
MIGLPADMNEGHVLMELQRLRINRPIKLEWKDFEGLEYLKVVFLRSEEAEAILR